MEKYMETDLRYLKSLANQYPTVAAAATEIINLQAILSLPKGTEHFITDIHGEYDQFQHVIRNVPERLSARSRKNSGMRSVRERRKRLRP